jgi:hypothetical protein
MLCQQLKEVRREDPPDLQGLNLSGAAVLHVTRRASNMSDGKTIDDIGHMHCSRLESVLIWHCSSMVGRELQGPYFGFVQVSTVCPAYLHA